MLEIETIKKLTDGPLGILNEGLARSDRGGEGGDIKISGWLHGWIEAGHTCTLK
jgi:hypothetical protein